MQTNKLFSRLATAVVLPCSLMVPVDAQVAPTQPAASSNSDQTVELSPFIVDASQDVGYLATNTLAGSRLNTSLRDTPSSISVLTPEFLSDIAAFDLREATGYAVNVELELADSDALGSDAGNLLADDHMSYRVRGLRASTARNYFVSFDLPIETSLVERVEDSRGPNSVLFGIGSPGGLLNVNTKQALTGRSFRKGSVTVGSYDSLRTNLDINQRLLDGKAAVRFNAVYNQNNSYRHWQYAEHKRAHLAATLRLTPATRIRAEFERGQIDDNEPRTQTLDDQVLLWNGLGRPTFAAVPVAATLTANGLTQTSTAATAPRVTYIGNNDSVLSLRGTMLTTGTNRVIADTRIADYSINVGGPGMDRTTRLNVIGAYLEHQFSKTAFLELAFNHLDINFDRYDARPGGSNQLRGDPNRLLPTGAPNAFAGSLMLESNWVHLIRRWNNDAGRITLSKEFDAGRWGNYRIAVLGEYRKAFVTSINTTNTWIDAATGAPAFNALPENGANQVWYRTYVTERDWASYHVPDPRKPFSNVREPVTGRSLSTRWVILNGNLPEEQYSSEKTSMVAGQARYFRGRVIVAAGYRRDDVDQFLVARRRDPVTREWTIARNPAEAEAAAQAAQWASHAGDNWTAGLAYHATRNVSLYYNRANNIGLSTWGRRVLPPNGMPGNIIPTPSMKGEGEDIGLALNLLDGRIHARATYYTTKAKNDTVSPPGVATGANTRIMDALQTAGIIPASEREVRVDLGNQALFDHESEGVELQVTTNVTKSWRLQANFAETKANETNRALEWLAWERQNRAYLADLNTRNPTRNLYGIVTSAARTIAEELDFLLNTNDGLIDFTEVAGKGKRGNRRYKASLFTRYNFTNGWLKGAFIGGGYRHQSKNFVGLDPTLNKIYGNSYWYADALAGYQLRDLGKGRRLGFQLNVMNVFDKRDPLVTRMTPDRANVVRYIVQPPRTWRLTTNFEF